MKIKFIKTLGTNQKGKISDIDSKIAKYLVEKVGIAEYANNQQTIKKEIKKIIVEEKTEKVLIADTNKRSRGRPSKKNYDTKVLTPKNG